MSKRLTKVLMIVYSHLPQDPRVRREANALKEKGYEVDIICLKRKHQSTFEIIDGINLFRLNVEKSRSSKSRYIILYLTFFFKAFIKVNRLWLKNRYQVVHVHNMPDFLIFIPFLQKLFGTKIILDLHDPTPEVYLAKFNSGPKTIKLLELQEKISIWFADQIITTNIAFVDAFVKRGCPKEKITIVMNSPDDKIFNRINSVTRNSIIENKTIIMYHGVILERHGLDILVRAIDLLKNKITNIELWVFGDGEFKSNFLELADELKLDKIIKYFGPVELETIAETIPNVLIGVIPNRLNPFTNINFPTRIFEYLHFSKPVVVPKTQGISDYFNDNSIWFFEPDNLNDLADKIFNAVNKENENNEILSKAKDVYLKHTWEFEKKKLVNLYKFILDPNA
ncbi:MAG: glycosyltransferase family 4 protein [Ignavibacteriaceae bacterium]